MRDPNNMIQIDYYNNDPLTIIQIDSIPEYDIEDYDLFDDKDRKKYFSDIERIVRGSFEYRQMVKFLHDNMDMNKCSFYENVNNIDSYKIKIHIHHDPITLYDICLIVFNKRQALGEPTDPESVAKEVMYLHYNMMVGLIPLAETVHELVHNQYLFVPTDKVFGKYREFVELYRDFMLPEQIDTLERIEEATIYYNTDSMNILAKSYIHLDLSGAYKLPRFEDVIQSMKIRIDDIKKGNSEPLIKVIHYEK